MNAAKIRLSPEEQELVFSPDWILTKNRILDKVKELLAGVQEEYAAVLNRTSGFPNEVLKYGYKISRGENYLGLPWLVLDYPRCFEKEDTFAIRTLFWWGKFFSFTLQLAGRYKERYEEKIAGAMKVLGGSGFYICMEDDPWQHHFEPSYYRPVNGMMPEEFNAAIRDKAFLKIAARFPLQQWEDVPVLLGRKFQEMMTLVSD
ncbi:MAG: hypothetical protein U0U70_06340 [Chitinophagaceae bacterium]